MAKRTAKSNQVNLFGEEQVVETKLEISPKTKAPLSKAQQDFNKITKRVEKLEKDLVNKEKKLDAILHHFKENFGPAIKEEAQMKIDLAFLFDSKIKEIKLDKKAKINAQDIIIALLEDAFEVLEPTKEQEELYDTYSSESYQEQKDGEIDMMKSMFNEMFSDMHGVDIDLTDFDIENMDDVARFQKELEEKLNVKDQSEKEKENKKPKTKKQLEKELLEKSKEEAKKKSIKSIYVSLSKVLHPDKESDDTLRIEKEELMKKVTVAYQEKDLATLLQLEMEWVHNTTEHLAELSDEKLKIYIAILRERADELESEKYMLNRNPKYMPIEHLAYMSEKSAIRHIESEKKDIKNNCRIFKASISAKDSIINKTKFKRYISEYYNTIVIPRIQNDFPLDFLFNMR
jgi:hypothetical protein